MNNIIITPLNGGGGNSLNIIRIISDKIYSNIIYNSELEGNIVPKQPWNIIRSSELDSHAILQNNSNFNCLILQEASEACRDINSTTKNDIKYVYLFNAFCLRPSIEFKE